LDDRKADFERDENNNNHRCAEVDKDIKNLNIYIANLGNDEIRKNYEKTIAQLNWSTDDFKKFDDLVQQYRDVKYSVMELVGSATYIFKQVVKALDNCKVALGDDKTSADTHLNIQKAVFERLCDRTPVLKEFDKDDAGEFLKNTCKLLKKNDIQTKGDIDSVHKPR